MAQFQFSVAQADIQSEMDTKFPAYDEADQVKNVMFSKLRDAGCTPVRYLSWNKSGNDWTLIMDVPKCDTVASVEDDVLPFSTQLA